MTVLNDSNENVEEREKRTQAMCRHWVAKVGIVSFRLTFPIAAERWRWLRNKSIKFILFKFI